MPSFGRLGKHSNRSHHALVESLTGSGAGAAAAGGSGSGSGSGSGGAATSARSTIDAASSSANTATPHSALSSSHNTTAFSSSESFDSRPQLLSQHKQQQHPPPSSPNAPPPPSSQQQQQHLYSSPSAASSSTSANPPPPPPHLQHNPDSGLGGSPVFDHQPQTQSLQHPSHLQNPNDFAEPVGRSSQQSNRYSVDPRSPYGLSGGSVDDLNYGPGSAPLPLQSQQQQHQHSTPPPPPPPQQQQQPPPGAEKRSTRKLIKGIFSGSNRGGSDQPHHGISFGHSHQQSYDNTGGLARRPSKRNSRVSLGNNTIRQVSGDVEPAIYEESNYHHTQPPQQQQQPPARFDYDQPPPPSHETHHQSPQLQHQYPYQGHQSPPPQQYPPGGDSRILSTHLGPSQQQNPETVSQFSHESPITDSDQRSANLQSASTSPAVKHSLYIQNQDSTPSLPPIPQQQQSTPLPPQQPGMAPAGGPPPSRRPQDPDSKLRGQGEPPAGPPPTYRHSGAPMNTMNPLPPVPQQGASQPPNYRGGQPPQFETQTSDQAGRTNSPQPSNSTAEPGEPDKFKDLLTKYKNVKRLYFDGKSQIELLTSQVEHLQNAVANQRMSQSRTALDDSEYSTRFNRLNGAINNLSFNIRKDWRSVPQWLESYVSPDALKTGKQEMTALGRAVISRWIVEEIFNKCFHPGLDAALSQQLKEIELHIRHNAYTMRSQEEFDALTNKVVSWRMTTLEGLNQKLNSPATVDNRNSLIEKSTTNLTATLFQYLNDPPPAGVQGSTSMIVELAVGIANNLPMESRDIGITYPLPGDMVQPHIMEVEKTPLPPLEGHALEEDDDDTDDGKDKAGKTRADKPKPGTLPIRSMLNIDPQAGREGSNTSTTETMDTDMATLPAVPKDPNKVRFAGFIALEVRGRQVLMKAPVWTL